MEKKEKKFCHLVPDYTLKRLYDKRLIPQIFGFTVCLYSYSIFAARLQCYIFPERYRLYIIADLSVTLMNGEMLCLHFCQH